MQYIDVVDINQIPKKNWIRVQCGIKNPNNCFNIVCYQNNWYHCSNWGSEAERDLGKALSDSEFFDLVTSWTDDSPYYFEGPEMLCYW